MMGPSYKEQQIFRKNESLRKKGLLIEQIYDEGVINTELAYNERLRNKLTPIVNLIEIFKHKEDFSTESYNKLLNENIISAETAVEEILNINK